MSDSALEGHPVSRIVCHVDHHLSPRVTDCMSRIGVRRLLVEGGRAVRLSLRSRPFGLPGTVARHHGSPVDLFRCTVPRESARSIVADVVAAAELNVPGHGSILVQDATEYRSATRAAVDASPATDADRVTLLPDLALVTCILSMPGTGEQLARVALELGACVPVVTLASGTGMRDRLGLLRITIPAEKEVVHLAVPAHDANSIVRLLLEEVRLDRPGQGLVYRTPVRLGLVDTRLRIGKQQHAASIEQIIAALDELKSGTSWRRRFPEIDRGAVGENLRILPNQREITIVCAEGRSGVLVESALRAGAGGATTARVRRMRNGDREDSSAARELSTLVVSDSACSSVTDALLEAIAAGGEANERIEVLESPAVFSYRR